ncbi:MAG TPA: DUF6132 family protein [Paludibacteraceae bacterium]|jgi:xanthine/uracil permease|nr:hypothetical protein [Paludibacteraceae bacterium]OPZ01305.1 MAG: hypothetical protein BWZ11_01751 [Bacteroidetes bacterium ADurb.BinA395]MBP8966739.1 hypothetical protein [Paludibacteraceae bacterium]HOF98398.1 DUF6132 family protein [Paludibacteraceae bacterium]HOJ65490.1 DUF6132 family protein [Paludibacteraceae bacterium]
MLKKFLSRHWLKVVGVLLGSIGGFAYFYFVGCKSGTCPISSNPYISIVYGAVLGYLFFDMFKVKSKNTNANDQED